MWVPVITWDGTEEDAMGNRADVPYSVNGFEWKLAPGAIARMPDGMPAVQHIKVYIHPDYVQNVRDHLIANHGTDSFTPDEHDVLWCKMMEHEQHNYFKSYSSIRQRFRNIANWQSMPLARKRRIKRVMHQMICRGYDSGWAQEIHSEASLENDLETSGIRDGDILKARYICAMRTMGKESACKQVDDDVIAGFLSEAHAIIAKERINAYSGRRVLSQNPQT